MAAKMERTRTPGIYRRGSRYVVVWEHRGRQHKQSFRTEREARDFKGRTATGDTQPTSRIRFMDYFAEWIESYAGRTARGFSETTRPEYRRPIEQHALPLWERRRLSEVDPSDVRELFGEMRRTGASTSQIKKLRSALSAMFATAAEDGKLRSNPCQGVRIPAAPSDQEPEEEHAKALTRAELAVLFAALPSEWRLFFEFMAHTGLRIGEAIGLRWEHVELGERPRVKVREQVYEGKRKRLKSRAGRRDVPLSPTMAGRLLAHRRDSYGGPDAPVFSSRTGTVLLPSNVSRRVLKPAAESVGLGWVSFHTLRHTCASLLFDAGRNVRQVQEWLGHSDPSFTLRTYVHLMDEGIGGAEFLDAEFSNDTPDPGSDIARVARAWQGEPRQTPETKASRSPDLGAKA
jgi:integrase